MLSEKMTSEAEKEVAKEVRKGSLRQGEEQVNRSPWGLDYNESHTYNDKSSIRRVVPEVMHSQQNVQKRRLALARAVNTSCNNRTPSAHRLEGAMKGCFWLTWPLCGKRCLSPSVF